MFPSPNGMKAPNVNYMWKAPGTVLTWIVVVNGKRCRLYTNGVQTLLFPIA
jgi:hypothetical protein